MEEFPGNSNKDKQDQSSRPRREKIVEGVVIQRKKSVGSKAFGTFFSGDAGNVTQYVLNEVLIPALKDVIADAASQAFERMLFGEARSKGRSNGYRSAGNNNYVSYNRMSSSSRDRDKREDRTSPRKRTGRQIDDVILATREEAEEVLQYLFQLTEEYDQVTLSDLYELVGIESDFTDERWGWTDMRGSRVVRTKHGYVLDLPDLEDLR